MQIEITASLPKRFWAKVEKTDTCWLWTGGSDKNGYGRIRTTTHRLALVHRASWVMHFGQIPDGMIVCHHCDTPGCVRPDHLFIGSVQDNVADMVNKGRVAVGVRRPISRLNADLVREIRRMSESGASSRAVARHFGISPTTAHWVITRYTWKHVI